MHSAKASEISGFAKRRFVSASLISPFRALTAIAYFSSKVGG